MRNARVARRRAVASWRTREGAGAGFRSGRQSSAEAETRGLGVVGTQHGDVAYGVTTPTQVYIFCARADYLRTTGVSSPRRLLLPPVARV